MQVTWIKGSYDNFHYYIGLIINDQEKLRPTSRNMELRILAGQIESAT